MLLTIIAPLLFSSELYTRTDETLQVHIETKQDIPNEPISEVGWNCVAYVNSRGVNLPMGDAIKQVPNSIPKVGGVVIMRYGKLGHVAYIEDIDSEGIHVSESNMRPGYITRRVLSVNDKHIVGYGYYQ